jgi:hypothetical protein
MSERRRRYTIDLRGARFGITRFAPRANGSSEGGYA